MTKLSPLTSAQRDNILLAEDGIDSAILRIEQVIAQLDDVYATYIPGVDGDRAMDESMKRLVDIASRLEDASSYLNDASETVNEILQEA